MRKIFFLSCILYCSLTQAQSYTQPDVKLPQVLPPAPEAAAIIKAGQLSVGLHTGAAQATVPIHTLTAGGLSFPVALSYASNGFKVDAIPGRAGMDWSMNTGVVTRTVHGIPDEKATHPTRPSDLFANTQAVLDYYELISDVHATPSGNYEGEPDEFNYSAPGLNGKFIMDYATGQPIMLSYSQDKINVVRNLVAQEITQIIITNSMGDKYFFGNSAATEHTVTHNMSGPWFSRQDIKTSFFLYRIENVYGDNIVINYSPVTIQTRPGVSMSISNCVGITEGGGCQTQSCPGYSIETGNLNGTASQIDYETVYPTSIVSSAGGVINFGYEARPDASGDKRLKTITVTQDANFVKTISLNYTDPGTYYGNGTCFSTATASTNKRFFLSQVSMVSNDQAPPLNYGFSYNDIPGLPDRLSYGQDIFGFYNGKSNTTLLPSTSYNYWFGSYGSADRSPDGAYSAKGLLSQITYPTGGTENFVYEPNTVSSGGGNIEAGGVRVKQVKSYDPVTQKDFSKYYKYATLAQPNVSTGMAPTGGQFISYSYTSQFCEYPWSAVPLNCKYIHLNANSVSSLFYFQSNHIGYTCITESDDPANAHGAIEHFFHTDISGPMSITVRGEPIYNVPSGTATSMNGIENRTRVVNSSGQTVKETINDYSFDTRISTIYYVATGLKRSLYQPTVPLADKCNSFDITLYQYYPQWLHLDKTTVKEYDPATGQMMQTVTDQYYDQLYHLQPNRTVTTSSENETLKIERKFASDLTGETYPSGQHPWQAMVSANIFDPVIEERIYRNPSTTNVPVAYTRNEMVKFLDGVKPAYMNLQKGTNSVETRIRYHKYSAEGQVLEMSKENDTRISFIWDYTHQLPVAEATNASWKDIAYTSFEANGTGNWSVPGTVYTGGGFTGTKAYYLSQGNITNNELDPAKDLTYIIQCWVDNQNNISVNSASGTLLMTKGAWKLVEFKVVDPTSITISGTALIDELRMFPEKAQMKTVTYLNGVGTLTLNDARNNVVFYEYDGFNRLIRIRDIDKNIVKQMEYKYGQSIAPCSNTTANWVATGTVRCQKDGSNCNTGIQEHQERDMNNCSSTYWTIRWVSDGVNSSCPAACTSSNCTGASKKCINCVCETGTKVYISSVYNRQTGMYTCTYYYYWSDSSQSQNYTEQSSTSCPIGIY